MEGEVKKDGRRKEGEMEIWKEEGKRMEGGMEGGTEGEVEGGGKEG